MNGPYVSCRRERAVNAFLSDSNFQPTMLDFMLQDPDKIQDDSDVNPSKTQDDSDVNPSKTQGDSDVNALALSETAERATLPGRAPAAGTGSGVAVTPMLDTVSASGASNGGSQGAVGGTSAGAGDGSSAVASDGSSAGAGDGGSAGASDGGSAGVKDAAAQRQKRKMKSCESR